MGLCDTGSNVQCVCVCVCELCTCSNYSRNNIVRSEFCELDFSVKTNNFPYLDSGSFFQGALMEALDDEVAHDLHQNDVNPYAQFVVPFNPYTSWQPDNKLDNDKLDNDKLPPNIKSVNAQTSFLESKCNCDPIYWQISSFCSKGNKMSEKFMEKLSNDSFDNFKLKALNRQIIIKSKQTQVVDITKFTEIFNQDFASEDIFYAISFLTPTAFKSNGQYVFFPDVRLILQSLAMKFGQLVDGNKDIDENLIDSFVKACSITSYNIRSHWTKIGKTKIPAFLGKIHLRVRGAKTLKGYIAMLLKFGEYFGVGVKTAMGMGAIHTTMKKSENKNITKQKTLTPKQETLQLKTDAKQGVN